MKPTEAAFMEVYWEAALRLECLYGILSSQYMFSCLYAQAPGCAPLLVVKGASGHLTTNDAVWPGH